MLDFPIVSSRATRDLAACGQHTTERNRRDGMEHLDWLDLGKCAPYHTRKVFYAYPNTSCYGGLFFKSTASAPCTFDSESAKKS